ncbi:MAG: signal peptidase I [Acutalibacteraceae bacterium]|nr:signal peptidase I [Acutalibacteraceae bacterium]
MFLSKRRMQVERTEYLTDGMTPEQAKKHRKKWLRIFDLCGSVVTAIVIIFVIFTFVFRPASVVGESMLPTLQNGDWLITIPQDEYEYGDIVVFTPDKNMTNHEGEPQNGEPYIKRVIATEGDRVEVNFVSGQVIVNGETLDEPYILDTTRVPGDVLYPVVVPEGKLFVMGDNRNNSKDSRSSEVGFVDKETVLGKVVFRVLPFGDTDVYENFNQGEE